MKKILITGGAGFIGSNAAEFFYNKKWKVIIIDNLSRKGSNINLKRIKNKISKFYPTDIKNFKKLNLVILKNRPNVVLHTAGQVAVTKSIEDPKSDFNDNLLGTLNVLESIRQSNIKTKLIYTSTNKVYGKLENIKLKNSKKRYDFLKEKKGINEKFNIDFHSPYGCSKGSADQYVNDYSRIYGLDTYVLRQSCIYGINQFGVEDQGWVAWFIIASILKKKIKIYGDGKQVRDILFMDDLNNLYFRIANHKKKFKNNIYNIGGGIKFSLSLLELIDLLKKYNINTNYTFEKWRDGDQKIFISDNSKIISSYGWRPKIAPKNGVEKLIKWVIKNKEIIKKIFDN